MPPVVDEPVVDAASWPTGSAAADCALVLHEAATTPLAAVELPAAGELLLVVGPEGGITDDELAVLTAAGARPCGSVRRCCAPPPPPRSPSARWAC